MTFVPVSINNLENGLELWLQGWGQLLYQQWLEKSPSSFWAVFLSGVVSGPSREGDDEEQPCILKMSPAMPQLDPYL